MLRVLTLATLFPDRARPGFGGFVERQCTALAQLPDVDLRVVAPRPRALFSSGRPERNMRAAYEMWKGLPVYRPGYTSYPWVARRLTPGSIVRSLKPLLQRLQGEFPFDVIDAEFFWPDGPAAVRLGEIFNVPVSIKARGSDIHYWGHKGSTAAMILDAARKADGLMSVSAALQRDMAALGMEESRIKVVYTGCDTERFLPGDRVKARAFFNLTGPAILMVGNLIPLKGHALVIEALRTLPDVTLLIAGDGPEKAELIDQVETMRLQNRVRFLGKQPHETLPLLYNAADLMVLPSSSEGLANAWVEALACGTPIVITDVGGAREILKDERCGAIVERTSNAIAESMKTVLTSKPDHQAIRNTVLHMTWQANAEATRDQLLKLVEAYPRQTGA